MLYIPVIAALTIVGILLYNPAKSYGIPAALIFMAVGLFIGNEEGLIPAYNYPNITDFISQFALSLIIFTGGLNTPFKKIKPVLLEGLMLSNLGVILSTILMGLFVSLVSSFSLAEALLLGAIVSSTDAAAVFSILETKQIKLKHNADKSLEFESATNDPMAMILTLALCSYLTDSAEISMIGQLLFFLRQLLVGAGSALIFGLILRFLFNRIRFREPGLIPILIIAMLLVSTEVSDLIGGNKLIASYLLGLMAGGVKIPDRDNTLHFYNSFSWLAQTAMFLLLGLQLFPSELLSSLNNAWLPTLFLFTVARPAAVLITYLPFRKISLRKKVFVSWIGLKGATPIVFALIPMILDIPRASEILNIVALIVIASMIIHGFTLKPAARVLKLLKE